MDRKLAALLLREVFLPGKYPYHINISSDDYSDNDIEKCMLDMEKEGLLHFWEQKVYLGDSTSTYHCTDFHLRVNVPVLDLVFSEDLQADVSTVRFPYPIF